MAAAGTCLGGGGLAAMEKTERQGGRGLPGSRLTVYGDVDPLPSLPRTNTQVLLFRKKKKLISSGQQQGFFSLPQLLCGLLC